MNIQMCSNTLAILYILHKTEKEEDETTTKENFEITLIKHNALNFSCSKTAN